MKPQNNATNQTKRSEARRRDLAKIHIAKKQLGLDDLTYREMLCNVAGVDSAADLDRSGRMKVLRHLKAHGFKSTHKSARASGMHVPPAPNRAPLLSKIGAILAEQKLSWAYADGIAKRMFKVDKARWLNPVQLHKLVAVLVYMQQRVKAQEDQLK